MWLASVDAGEDLNWTNLWCSPLTKIWTLTSTRLLKLWGTFFVYLWTQKWRVDAPSLDGDADLLWGWEKKLKKLLLHSAHTNSHRCPVFTSFKFVIIVDMKSVLFFASVETTPEARMPSAQIVMAPQVIEASTLRSSRQQQPVQQRIYFAELNALFNNLVSNILRLRSTVSVTQYYVTTVRILLSFVL